MKKEEKKKRRSKNQSHISDNHKLKNFLRFIHYIRLLSSMYIAVVIRHQVSWHEHNNKLFQRLDIGVCCC